MGIFDNFNLNFNFGANNWFTPSFYFPQFTFPSFNNVWSGFNFSFSDWKFPTIDYSVFTWNRPVNFSSYAFNPYPPIYTQTFTPMQSIFTEIASPAPATSSFGGSFFDLSLPKITAPKITPPAIKPSDTPPVAAKPSKPRRNRKSTPQGTIKNDYIDLNVAQAEKKARTDENLENLQELSKGKKWSISAGSFKTDIPYAKKGTAEILDKVTEMIGEEIVITSALATGHPKNPHKKSGYDSHHNSENPKLDIRTRGNSANLAEKLRKTGYFSWIYPEGDHLDVQIDPKKYNELDAMG